MALIPSRFILGGLAAAWMTASAWADPPVASHDDSFSKEGLFKADVSKLKDTQLAAHPDTPLAENKNVLWCDTLQLAWNEAIGLVGEKLKFANQPPVVDLLNREDFTDADLAAGSYVAMADFERNNVEDEIRAALEKTFNGAASPELIPPKPPHPGPDDFVAYAYLYKNLAFADPFADNDPLTFGAQQVANFGFTKNLDRIPGDVFGQVSIYDYQSENDFIIKLKTKSPDDELILAKIAPGPTFQETITRTLKRISQNKPEFVNKETDQLSIPKLNFDLRGDFPELEGLILEPSPSAHVRTLILSKAQQLIRFQLNENGAVLKSEATIAMAASAVMEPPKPHIMIFDRPFLILMKQAKSDQPYFALWVGNASLLVPAAKAD
jgi:hypothetical protein